ncbi:transposase, IS1634 family [Bathymodiolus japonicus methanotrophic gill symbiont]|uniref:IS1634 family transposase n=1 Tax=Bathymodiolus japonicus methanotrophic gill symbiont TaxID=113269 RepID=UPI001B4C46D5|nr:IS1634 family transposase [Bathymodiolus japonicus methanotrophic gill symbiont]GFO73466.1 transposase, IS1634 family [Bathymodiolus japonicus methanotrophic gill symbiont]
MYIRRTKTKSLEDGSAYFTYRIVESVRIGKQVKQRTLLNIGADFTIDKKYWPLLTARIEQLQQGLEPHQEELFNLADDLNQLLEATAQRYSSLMTAKLSQPLDSKTTTRDFHHVDINHVEAINARSIGVETLALHAAQQLQLDEKLMALGFNKVDTATALGTIIGRMVSPGSELQTHDWLQNQTGLGELLGHDYGNTSLTRLYTVSDKLLKHQATLEYFLADREQTLFNLNRKIVLYDLTNTYFEGQCARNPKAKFGRSKEKRTDCPLVTLGLVLDGDGFPLSSQVFPGNASEPATLKLMLDELRDKDPFHQIKPVVIMDAGIASADNIAWLIEQDYHYLVVSREQHVKNPRDQKTPVAVRDTRDSNVVVYREVDQETGETRLYCHSEQKAKKEQGIRNRFHARLEEALEKLHTGLSKKGTLKKYDKILERIGRLREKHSRVAADYTINVIADDKKNKAIGIEWQRKPESDQKDKHCGVYCLRTNIPDWSEEQLWLTYTMLTEIEATFRSLKTELGLRPVYHKKEERVTGHLFITLLAYHLVHVLRYQLRLQDIHLSWESIRNRMSTQQRMTITLPTDNDTIIHLRTTSKAETRQKQIYTALNINPDPIGKVKTIVDMKPVVPTGAD